MRFSTWIIHRKQTASFRIAGLMLAIAPMWLMLAAANLSAHAQTSDDISNSAAVAPSPADWTQFHRDNMQRWNPYETVLGVNNVGGLQVKWKNPIGEIFNTIESSPAVVNGVVYFGSPDRNVYALNASTGAKLWSFAVAGAEASLPTVANGVVYFGSADSNVYALNAATGAKLWSFAASGIADLSSPAVVNGVVYICTQSGNVYALSAATGAKLWSFAGDASPFHSPAVANGVVYFGSADNNVYALNAATGAKLWSYATGGLFITSPAVANGVVYVCSSDGNVYALNASTGAKLWSYATGFVFYASPAVANGVVYINSWGGNLYALNASTGAKLWSYTIGSRFGVSSSPTIVDGVVYIRAGDPNTRKGNVYAFSLGSADLFLRMTPSTTTVHQGDLLTYAFPVWNLGPDITEHEVLTTQVPKGTTFDYIRISGTPGLGTCTHPPYGGTGQIICHEGDGMAPNTTWTVRLTVKVTAPAGTVITESAATLADTPDPNMTNNTATVSIKVQ